MVLKKYKIFVDAHVFDGEYQGTLTYIKEIYLEYLKLNSNTTIYFGANKVENVKKYFSEFKNVEFITYKSKTSLKRIFFEIPKIIDDLKCTHAHFQYTIPFRKNKNCKYITTIHDILFNDFPKEFSFLYRFQRNILFFISAKRCDHLLTVSNYSKSKISKQYRINEDKITVTPNAVSEDYFQFKPSKSESRNYINEKYGINKYILYVSRIEPRKNQTILLKAFMAKKLWKLNLTLVLIGSNTLDSNLFEQINNLDEEVKNVIIWIEQVEYEALKHFLNGAEIFVYPSKAEGFGIPPLEAGALFTPVLCSNATAMIDFDFFKPFMFNPDDYDNFVRMLLDLLKNKESIDVTSIQSSIMKKYSWEASAKIMLKEVIGV